MITINLLGDEKVVGAGGRLLLILFVGAILISTAALGVLTIGAEVRLSELSTERDVLTTQVKALEEKTKEVADLETRRRELGDRLGAIAQLRLAKRGPVKLLDEINRALPAKVWITDLKEVGGQMTISGIAVDHSSVSAFAKALESSQYIKDPQKIEIKSSSQVYLVRVASDAAIASRLTPKPRMRGGKQRNRRASGVASPAAPQVIFKLAEQSQLSADEREGFRGDRPGFGLEVRSFVITAEVTYVGRERLKILEAQKAAAAAAVVPEGAAKSGRKRAKAKKDEEAA